MNLFPIHILHLNGPLNVIYCLILYLTNYVIAGFFEVILLSLETVLGNRSNTPDGSMNGKKNGAVKKMRTGVCATPRVPVTNHSLAYVTNSLPPKKTEVLLPKSRMVKFLFLVSSFGDLKENCCPALGRSWSLALKVWITCSTWRQEQRFSHFMSLFLLRTSAAATLLSFEAAFFLRWHGRVAHFSWCQNALLLMGYKFCSRSKLFWQKM